MLGQQNQPSMSDELNVGHYFKRICAINVQFGDPAYHLMRYAQQS